MSAYLLILALLLVFELAYVRVAEHFGVTDSPNARSSHRHVTVRGGGIVFVAAAVAYFVWSGGAYPWFVAGFALITGVSFYDDLKGAPIWTRLVGQFAGMAMIMCQTGIDGQPWWLWAAIGVGGVAFLNAYNFMDGINGSAGIYTVVALTALAALNDSLGFIDPHYIYVAGLGALVFCFFNVRTNARCFAGDVGSLAMGAIVLFPLLKLMLGTGNWGWIVLVSVYGTDAALTIMRRLARRQNIFAAHRMHAYQLLCNELGHSHLSVAASYAGVQIVVDLGAMLLPINSYVYLGTVVALLAAGYCVVVRRA